MAIATVRDIMEKDVVVVHPETSIFDAHEILESHRFDGVPVVDAAHRLVGILTEYDLIVKGSSLHLPTFQKILNELDAFKKDRLQFSEDAATLQRLTVHDVMNADPLTFSEDITLEEVVAVFRDHHRVNPIPVITADKTVVGIVSRYDVLKLFAIIRPVS